MITPISNGRAMLPRTIGVGLRSSPKKLVYISPKNAATSPANWNKEKAPIQRKALRIATGMGLLVWCFMNPPERPPGYRQKKPLKEFIIGVADWSFRGNSCRLVQTYTEDLRNPSVTCLLNGRQWYESHRVNSGSQCSVGSLREANLGLIAKVLPILRPWVKSLEKYLAK